MKKGSKFNLGDKVKVVGNEKSVGEFRGIYHYFILGTVGEVTGFSNDIHGKFVVDVRGKNSRGATITQHIYEEHLLKIETA